MKLFKYEGYKIVISEEAFAIKVFRQIWNRDKTVNKDKALSELGYIYFMEDPRSDYQYIIDEEDRSKAIIEAEGLSKNWKPDKLVKEAMNYYSSIKTTSSLLLEDLRATIDNIRRSLKTFSFENLEEKDRVNAIKSVASTIATLPKLIKDLNDTEKLINSEMQQQAGKIKGQKTKSLMEDSLL